MKNQLESCRKEQEKLLLQMKSQLAEKERVNDELNSVRGEFEDMSEAYKTAELQVSTLV